jgi:hypothetical protein
MYLLGKIETLEAKSGPLEGEESLVDQKSNIVKQRMVEMTP